MAKIPTAPVLGAAGAAEKAGLFRKLLSFVKGTGKWGAIVGGTTALAGGLAWWAQSSRDSAERESRMELREQAMARASLPPVGADTLMGMERTPGEHAARVLAGRGMGAAQGFDASNPNIPSPDGRPVQDLGAPRV